MLIICVRMCRSDSYTWEKNSFHNTETDVFKVRFAALSVGSDMIVTLITHPSCITLSSEYCQIHLSERCLMIDTRNALD